MAIKRSRALLISRAHDLEKRQHLFSHGVLKPSPPSRTGMFGSGTALDITPEVVRAEREIHAKWSHKPAYAPKTVEVEEGEDLPPSYEMSEIVETRTFEVAPQSSSALRQGGSSAESSGRSASIDVAGPGPASQRVPPPLPPRKGNAEARVPGGY